MKTTLPTIKIGTAIVLAACGMAVLVHLHPEKLRAPAWLAFFALGLFGFCGICVIALALRRNDLARRLVCVLLGAMTVIPGWIAFGGGPRQCSFVSAGVRSTISEMACRGAFGVGAVILLVMFAAAVRSAFRQRQAD